MFLLVVIKEIRYLSDLISLKPNGYSDSECQDPSGVPCYRYTAKLKWREKGRLWALRPRLAAIPRASVRLPTASWEKLGRGEASAEKTGLLYDEWSNCGLIFTLYVVP